MAPNLTDTQQRADSEFDKLITQWNGLPDAQKKGSSAVKDQLEAVVRERNGAEAWPQVAQALSYGKPTGAHIRESLDAKYPRVDTGSAASSGPSASRPAQDSHADDAPLGSSEGIYNAEPGDGRSWLPGNRHLPTTLTADDYAALLARDVSIEKINKAHFNVDPAMAWRPDGATLPATGINISTFGDTFTQANDLLGKFASAVAALQTAFNTGAAEPLIAQERDRMKASLDALTTVANSSNDIPKHLSAGAVAANDAFHQMRGENLHQRQAMADNMGSENDARDRLVYPLSGFLPQVTEPTKITDVAAAAESMKTLSSTIATPTVLAKQVGFQPKRGAAENAGAGAGAAGGGGDVTLGDLPGDKLGADKLEAGGDGGALKAPGPDAGLAGSKNTNADDISKLLSQLAGSASPLAQQAAQIPQQMAQIPQQMAQIPQQLANAVQRAAHPNNALNGLKGTVPANAKLTSAEKAAADDAKTDRAAATEVAYTKPNPAAAEALGAPGSTARPNQLDATGKPVDKNGDGKVDEKAVPLSKGTVKPFDLSVPADGKNVQVKGVPDPRLGEMMLNMAKSDPEHPTSVLEAAKSAGMDIKALGDPMEAKLAKVGDAVIGDTKSGIYLGDNQVLTSAGHVENLSDVVGKNGFVSEIPLPELPDAPAGEKTGEKVSEGAGTPAGTATVSDKPLAAEAPPATPVTDTSPAPAPAPNTQLASANGPAPAAAALADPAPAAPSPAAPAPAAPAQADPAPAAGPGPAPALAPVPAPAAKAGGGLPKQVPYEGHPLGG